MTARVAQATYLGQDLHLRLVIGEQNLTAVAQGSALRNLNVGDEINAAIAASDILTLPT